MLPVVWRASARDDLHEIVTYIARENPAAARRMKDLLAAAIIPVAEHPYLFRVSERIPGLREVVAHPNYIVLYKVASDRIEVVSVVHARRQFPNLGSPNLGSGLAR